MKAASARILTGIWTIILLSVISAGAVAQSETDSQKAGDEISPLHDRIEATIVDGERLKKLIAEAEGDMRTMLEHRLE
jgi:hypothetical protein